MKWALRPLYWRVRQDDYLKPVFARMSEHYPAHMWQRSLRKFFAARPDLAHYPMLVGFHGRISVGIRSFQIRSIPRVWSSDDARRAPDPIGFLLTREDAGLRSERI